MSDSQSSGLSCGNVFSTKADFNEMLSSIKVIEQQMDGIKREPADVQKTTSSDNLVQKIRREKRIQFKRKSNEKQYQFNQCILDKLQSVRMSLNCTPPNIEKAKEALKEIEQRVDIRQKHI